MNKRIMKKHGLTMPKKRLRKLDRTYAALIRIQAQYEEIAHMELPLRPFLRYAGKSLKIHRNVSETYDEILRNQRIIFDYLPE